MGNSSVIRRKPYGGGIDMRIVCQCRGCQITRSGSGYSPCSNREPKPEFLPPPPLVDLDISAPRRTRFWGKWFR